MSTYRVVRTETIIYSRDFTREELEDMGVPPSVFTDGDLTADFADELSLSRSDALREALENATEPYGDVQGSDYRIETAT